MARSPQVRRLWSKIIELGEAALREPLGIRVQVVGSTTTFRNYFYKVRKDMVEKGGGGWEQLVLRLRTGTPGEAWIVNAKENPHAMEKTDAAP